MPDDCVAHSTVFYLFGGLAARLCDTIPNAAFTAELPTWPRIVNAEELSLGPQSLPLWQRPISGKMPLGSLGNLKNGRTLD
jgi:hypothetical protein